MVSEVKHPTTQVKMAYVVIPSSTYSHAACDSRWFDIGHCTAAASQGSIAESQAASRKLSQSKSSLASWGASNHTHRYQYLTPIHYIIYPCCVRLQVTGQINV